MGKSPYRRAYFIFGMIYYLIRMDRHDNMAGNMGSSGPRFFDTYENEVDIIQRKMVEYIKMLQPSATSQPNLSRPDLRITTKDGYPWLPPTIDGTDQKKEELEKLLRAYMNDHYSEFRKTKVRNMILIKIQNSPPEIKRNMFHFLT